MKTRKIFVNRTPQQPQGVPLEVVEPQGDLDARVLSFLLSATLREIKRSGKLEYDLPDFFTVEYTKDGSFVVSKPAGLNSKGIYEKARPIAVLGIRMHERGIDIVHAALKVAPPATIHPDPLTAPAAPGTPQNTEAPAGEAKG